jgi:hypothetical protein
LHGVKGTITPFDRAIQAQVVNRFFALHAVWFPREPTGADAAAEFPLDAHFRGPADLAVFRRAWSNPGAIFVGLKAGENCDHHNHLDLGSFVLDADGQRWAMDLGPDSPGAHYDLPGYFDNQLQRWTCFSDQQPQPQHGDTRRGVAEPACGRAHRGLRNCTRTRLRAG